MIHKYFNTKYKINAPLWFTDTKAILRIYIVLTELIHYNLLFFFKRLQNTFLSLIPFVFTKYAFMQLLSAVNLLYSI